MKHKTIFLPDWLEPIVHALTIIPILIVELFYYFLTPITWLKRKFHIVIFALCIVLSCYLHFTHIKNAFIYAAVTFVLFALVIATLKWLRKRLKKIDESLLHYFHLYPLARVEINIPTINKKISSEEKNYEKADKNHYNNPYHKHCCDTMRSDPGSRDNT